jgi:hypothetical protein
MRMKRISGPRRPSRGLFFHCGRRGLRACAGRPHLAARFIHQLFDPQERLHARPHEGTEIDPRNARYVNDNLRDSIPLNDRLRSVKVSLVAEENQLERGLGEPANFGTASAVLALRTFNDTEGDKKCKFEFAIPKQARLRSIRQAT